MNILCILGRSTQSETYRTCGLIPCSRERGRGGSDRQQLNLISQISLLLDPSSNCAYLRMTLRRCLPRKGTIRNLRDL